MGSGNQEIWKVACKDTFESKPNSPPYAERYVLWCERKGEKLRIDLKHVAEEVFHVVAGDGALLAQNGSKLPYRLGNGMIVCPPLRNGETHFAIGCGVMG